MALRPSQAYVHLQSELQKGKKAKMNHVYSDQNQVMFMKHNICSGRCSMKQYDVLVERNVCMKRIDTDVLICNKSLLSKRHSIKKIIEPVSHTFICLHNKSAPDT